MLNQKNYNSNNNNKLDYNHVLENLQDYMLTNKNIVSALRFQSDLSKENKEDNSKKNIIKKPLIKANKESYIFYPKEKDMLFWIIYIMKNGMDSYETLENKNIVNEKRMKIEYVELLRKKKSSIKSHKIAPLNYIENYLVNEEKIDLKTFLALCIIEELDIIYSHKKTYYEFSKFVEDDEPDIENKNNKINVVVRLDESGDIKYGYYVNVTNTKITEYRDKYYKMENIDKPIKVFSAYKLEDLIELCKKLAIDTMNPITNKKKTKKELYESIVQYF